jgi:nucleotide-binding universal stress UspA family protein
VPSRLLVCVAVGEPGKADVRFAERLAWQLGARATVLTVLDESTESATPPHVSRFLAACERAMSQRGVVARGKVRRGPVEREIRAEVAEGEHDLVVVGAPLASAGRHVASLDGPVERLLHHPPDCPLLVVRRQEVA